MPSPDLLVTGDGRHLAVVQDGTPLILRDRAGDYVRSLLAEASGYDGDPDLLDGQPTSDCSHDACVALLREGTGQWRLLATRSAMRIDWQVITAACTSADIVVSDRRLPRACEPRWLKLDPVALGRTGGLAIYPRRPPMGGQRGRTRRHPSVGQMLFSVAADQAGQPPLDLTRLSS